LADGSLSNALLVALRRGKLVAIQGISASDAPAGVAFSAIGFSAAFSAMAKECNRPGVMAWIE
jgi:invasion protein IalB